MKLTKMKIELLPAFTILLECMEAIADTHGEARAIEWFEETYGANTSLFMRVSTGPRLTLIRGGAE